MEKERNSNFELLRIICIILIILYHYFVHGGYIINSSTINSNVIFLSTLSWGGKVSCNIFIIITGYFMVNKKINYKKIISLILQMFFYSYIIIFVIIMFDLVDYSFSDLLKQTLPIFYGNWFLICYIQLYILIPVINRTINSFNRNKNLNLILTLLFIFSLIPTFIPSAYYIPSNITVFIMMYLIGAFIKIYSPKILNNRKVSIFNMIISILIMHITIISFVLLSKHFNNDSLLQKVTYFTNIYSFLTIVCSITIFITFKNLNIKSKIINYISSSCLGIYLIHDNLLLRKYIWLILFPNINYINSSFMIIHLIIKVFSIFLICLIIDKLRLFVLKNIEVKITDKIYNFCNKIIKKVFSKNKFKNACW